MPPPDTPLDVLRREIDAVDDAMHELLMKRAALSEQVRVAKDGGRATVFRPGREAAILRRLVDRHHGALPPEVVAQVWREIISASIRLQGAFAAAVYAPSGAPQLLDLARVHFGVLTPLLAMGSVGAVLSAVSEGRAQTALLPLPEEIPAEPWWRGFGGGGPSALNILARVPFVAAAPGAAALVVGPQPFEPTGEDGGYLVVETSREVSRARLAQALSAVDLRPKGFPAEASDGRGRDGSAAFLVESEDYAGPDDPRLSRLAEQGEEGIVGVRSIGGYAMPLMLAAARRQK